MRQLVASCIFLIALNCGGGDKPADHPSGDNTAASDAGQSANTGPTTTTTVLMGDAGELQGSKLTTTNGPTTFDGGSNSSPSAGSGHDPGRSQQDIYAIIQTHRAEARACYDTYEKTHRGAKGNVDITWKLDPKGAVVETGIDDAKSDLHDPDLVKCIGDVIKKIPWAPSPRGFETRAHYPFNFNPHGTTGTNP